MATLPVVIDAARARSGANEVKAALDLIEREAIQTDRALDGISVDGTAARAGLAEVNAGFRDLSGRAAVLQSQLTGLFIGGLGAGFLVREAAQASDSYANLQNRLRQVTDSEQELNSVTNELIAISGRSRSSLAATSELYVRVALSARELGKSEEELLQFTESLNQAVLLSGASATEANAALVQLSQGIASGALRGDELRSVLEQLPAVADVIAERIGVTRGELRELGAQGLITADIIIQAFAEAREELAQNFGETIPTIGQRVTDLGNTLVIAAGKTDGLNQAIGDLVAQVTDGIKVLFGMDDALVGSTARAQATAEAIVGIGVALGGLAIIATGPIGLAAAVLATLTVAYVEIREAIINADEAQTAYSESTRRLSADLGEAAKAQKQFDDALRSGDSVRTLNLAQQRVAALSDALQNLEEQQRQSFVFTIDAGAPQGVDREALAKVIPRIDELFPESEANGFAAFIDRLFGDAADATIPFAEAIAAVRDQLDLAELKLADAEDRFAALGDTMKDDTKSAKELFEEQKNQKKGVDDLVLSLEKELIIARLNDQQRAVSAALLRAQAEARKENRALTQDEINDVIRLSSAIFEAEEARKAATEAEEDLKRKTEEHTKARRQLIDSLIDERAALEDEIKVIGLDSEEARNRIELLELERELRKAVEAGILSQEQALFALKERADQLAELEALKETQALADSLAGSLTNAAGALLEGGDPSAVLENLRLALQRTIIEALILKPLLDAIRGSASEGTGLAGFLGGIGLARGGVLSSAGQVVPFQHGGIVTSPTAFPLAGGNVGVAGEAGAEGILPLARGPSGELGVKAQGGGGRPIYQTININGVRDMDSFRRSERTWRTKLQRAAAGNIPQEVS